MTLFRYLVPSLAALAVLGAIEVPSAQGPAIPDKNITYILPAYLGFTGAAEAQFADHLARLKALGESARVRTGFTAYVHIRMDDWNVEVNDPAALRAGLAGTIASIDAAIARARANDIPIAITFWMPLRSGMDAVQAASQAEDVRTMQWFADNTVASGWWSHSQYARNQRRVMEAYIRELGRVVANRMATYPETLVAVTGDGEVELAWEAAKQKALIFADYSPFAVLEFRDWLTARGLYATGQPLAADAYEHAARYKNDPSPSRDGNGDGRTLAGDFGASLSNPGLAFMTSWDLKHFDWRLTDEFLVADPGAIPEAVRKSGQFLPLPATVTNGFDAPRVFDKTDAWWRLWHEFRQHLIHRYNRDFAKWMTTSPDPASGATVPSWRFHSDQIPADFLNGFTGEDADPRFWLSASAFWTADVSPYGSIGITSFNAKYKNAGNPDDTKDYWALTLAAVAPEIGKRNKRWGIIEWNPAPSSTDPATYRQDNDLIVKYRPSLLIPWALDYKESVRVWDTGFDVALKELIQQLGTAPLRASPSLVNTAATSDTVNPSRTAPQIVRVSGIDGERTPSWTVTGVPGFLDVKVLDGTSFSVQPLLIGLPAAEYTDTVTVTPSDPSYSPVTVTVKLKVSDPAQTLPPTGAFDTPAEDALVEGEVAITGWATDDVGVAAVDIYRDPVGGESHPMFIGSATFVEGSRTDVEALIPDNPQKGLAGWGYMLLSNFLPNGGQGTFTLRAVARDQEGHTALLGTRRIVANNGAAQLPFGTIDTPAQGQTVSGVIRNWAWALAPGGMIPLDGSTIGVYIDNVFVGRPRYGLKRDDIASLFPGYPNTDAAVGYFDLDTRTLSNGVHTIAWVVRDSLGHAQGIGSRFFTVSNP